MTGCECQFSFSAIRIAQRRPEMLAGFLATAAMISHPSDMAPRSHKEGSGLRCSKAARGLHTSACSII